MIKKIVILLEFPPKLLCEDTISKKFYGREIFATGAMTWKR